MVSYLQVENLTKSFGNLVLFENISFTIGQGERVSLIAKNGAGKSTLLNIIAGNLDFDSGAIVPQRGLRIAYLSQDPKFPANMSVLQACFHSENESLRAIADYKQALASGNTDDLQRAMELMDSLSAWDYEQRAIQILTRLKITNLDQNISELSGGQLKRVALAGVLISESDLLILDEPTNHLDIEMTEWLEGYLAQSSSSLLMVTHDRYFLDTVCSDIIEIDNGLIYTYKGNYSYYLEKRQERMSALSAKRESEENIYRRELEWMRRQPKARATKAKSRIESFNELEDRLRTTASKGDVKLDVKASYIGTKIFEMVGVSKSYGDLKLIENFSYNFSRYEKMGVVGNNGTGKSTFIKMLTGSVSPDTGTVDVGESVRFGYYSQNGLNFDPLMKVIDVVTAIAEYVDLGQGRKMSASQFLHYFLFTPPTQQNFVSKLSGGERRRLYLCTILMQNPNFLVLDEPTNDLDIVTLGILEEYLSTYNGCLIVVSHDRYFMDKVADHLLVFMGDGVVKDFPGSYSDYVDWKRLRETTVRTAQSQTKAKGDDHKKPPFQKKLSYKEQQELQKTEETITKLEAQKSDLEAELASGVLSIETLTQKSFEVSSLISLIEENTLRWLELSEKG